MLHLSSASSPLANTPVATDAHAAPLSRDNQTASSAAAAEAAEAVPPGRDVYEDGSSVGVDGALWQPRSTFGRGSQYYGIIFDKVEADRLMAAILLELEPLWLPRDDPSVVFSIYGRNIAVTRDKAILGEVVGSVSPLYRYGSPERAVVHSFTPTLAYIRDRIQQGTGVRCNHLVVNRYVNNSDQIGFHMDKDKDFTDDYSIVTVSFGATRAIQLRACSLKGGKASSSIDLPHGSVYRLNQATNKSYKHSIPRAKEAKGVRLGLTYRTIATTYNHVTGTVTEKAVAVGAQNIRATTKKRAREPAVV